MGTEGESRAGSESGGGAMALTGLEGKVAVVTGSGAYALHRAPYRRGAGPGRL